MCSCLEASANLHLKPVLEHLKSYELYGVFDEKFGEPIVPSSSFSVMGFVDVISKISLAKKTINKMANMSLNMDHILLIDSPAFNIPLAKAIRKINKKVKITYYILPQVWAWKAKRVKVVESLCNNLCSIMPFEKDFYTKSVYVGHPLLDELDFNKINKANNNTIAFMPGSRKSEIKKLMGVFRQLKNALACKALLVVPSFFDEAKINELYGDTSGFELVFDTQSALAKSEFAFICSGTATLEAALLSTPFALVYKAKWLDFMIAKTFVKLKHVGIANIIFDFANIKPLHKEFLQEEVNVQNLINEYKNLNKEEFYKHSKLLKDMLRHGSSKEVARMILI